MATGANGRFRALYSFVKITSTEPGGFFGCRRDFRPEVAAPDASDGGTGFTQQPVSREAARQPPMSSVGRPQSAPFSEKPPEQDGPMLRLGCRRLCGLLPLVGQQSDAACLFLDHLQQSVPFASKIVPVAA
jgi:hypothetical protein